VERLERQEKEAEEEEDRRRGNALLEDLDARFQQVTVDWLVLGFTITIYTCAPRMTLQLTYNRCGHKHTHVLLC